MFTPQPKSPWTPPSFAMKTTRFSAADKGKAVAFIDGPSPPPPTPSRGENVDDWKRFKEVGLLDEASLKGKDRRALLDKISKLEKELFDYQYNMGLLLIENKDLASKNEEIGHEYVDAQEMLKREKNAHLIAISEAEQREENLKKALGSEKKCLVDLERALHDTLEEHAEFKILSETTVADVNMNVENLEKKRRDLEAKVHLADAKLAASERKNSEVDRKLQDLESRERILERQLLSFAQEKTAHQAYFHKHKTELIEWERKLQEREQRLSDGRRILKEREEKLHETDRTSKEKEAYMDGLQQKIDSADATLKKIELDVQIKLADLDSKEKKAETMRCELEMTERKLIENEERLTERETVELENLLNKHKKELDARTHEYELEIMRKRNSLETELNSRMQEVDVRKSEINHLEDMLGKTEQALEKKSERVKEKEKGVDGKMKALKEREKSVKAEEKSLELSKKELSADKESLEDLKKELEMWKTNMKKQELQIEEELKELEVLQEERSNYLRLQVNLKNEIEIARRQSELLEKEAHDMKLEREKLEKDWEALDEKRATVDNNLKILAEERARFEKFRNSEEDIFKRKRAEREENLLLESERIRLERESFEATMEHQKKMFDEKAKTEHSLMLQDLVLKRHDFSNDVRKRQKEQEMMMEEKERALEERKLREMQNLSHLKEDAERERKVMETEKYRLKKESEEMEVIKKQLDETRFGMLSDVEALDNLSKTMKKQREEFASERHFFFSLIEQIKSCRNCGDSAQGFLQHGLQLPNLEGSSHVPRLDEHRKDKPTPIESSAKTSPSPVAVNQMNFKSGGEMSVLRKCVSDIFKSPKEKIEPIADGITEETPSSASKNRPSSIRYGSGEVKSRTRKERRPSFGIVNESLKNSRSDIVGRDDIIDSVPSVDVSNTATAEQGGQGSEASSKTGRRKAVRKRGLGVRRMNSVKTVVEDAKAILDKGSVGKKVSEVTQEPRSVRAESKISPSARKRSRSHTSKIAEIDQDLDHSEGIADSASTDDGRRKRQQTGYAVLPTLGRRRYNLRRHTVLEHVCVEQASSDKLQNKDEVASKGIDHNPDELSAQSLDVDSGSRLKVVQVSTTRSIEISSDRIVKFATTDLPDNHFDAAKSQENASLLSREANSGENTPMTEEVIESKDDMDDDDSSDDDSSGGGGDEEEVRHEDDPDGHPGQTSIGKKLWTFFTT